MPKRVIVTAQVEDPESWEAGFRTHADLFREQTVTEPVEFAITGDQVAVCFEPQDFDVFMEVFESDATAEAIKADGVKRETAQLSVLDKTLEI